MGGLAGAGNYTPQADGHTTLYPSGKSGTSVSLFIANAGEMGLRFRKKRKRSKSSGRPLEDAMPILADSSTNNHVNVITRRTEKTAGSWKSLGRAKHGNPLWCT
eukprot:6463225-Amphidinium_carterae.2